MAGSRKYYNNFVRPASPENERINRFHYFVSGDEARKMYLEEVGDVSNSSSMQPVALKSPNNTMKTRLTPKYFELSDKELFRAVQANNVDKIRQVLDSYPDKINKLDEYGWSLLMIACQANAIGVVEELLKRGVSTTVRDKAGNSARSLIIKNRNLELVDLLLKLNEKDDNIKQSDHKTKVKIRNDYSCNICNNIFSDKEEHLSSTLHNINASKGKKIPTAYKIPQSNKGYQIMLRVGWDRENGLGPEGAGYKYPIRTVQKKDRLGLGHEKQRKHQVETVGVKIMNKRIMERHKRNEKRIEVNFRREFY